jgi:acyl-CoA synthetase (NDP forming)
VVLKIVSPQIIHKSDVGGVSFLPADPAAVQSSIEEMLAAVENAAPRAVLDGVLVAERVAYGGNLPGCEYLVSCRRDSAFGPVIVFALGGLLTEWYGELAEEKAQLIFSAHNFDGNAALAAIEATTLGKIALHPSRLHPQAAPVTRRALKRTLEGLARIAVASADGRGIEELEINPMAALEGRLVALDGFARTAAQLQPDRAPRPVGTVRALLHPRSALVLGASQRSQNAGRIILQNLRNARGIAYGHLYALHNSAATIEGIPCVTNCNDLPEVVDLAVVALPADSAVSAIRELVESAKARSIILITGGFAETGNTERARAVRQALDQARQQSDGGPVLVGGNCLGIVSKNNYNTFFLPSYKLPFNDAPGESLVVISQSGAYLVSFTSNLDSIIFPRATISYGNEMDLTASDFFEYYLRHESDVRVFAFYIEGFAPTEGERFVRLTREATSRGKPVIIYKAGRTEFGARAAASHTASMVGNYRVTEALLQEAGALVVPTLNRFEDYTKAITMLSDRELRGRRLAVITNAGFEAGAVSDHLYGLELAELQDVTLSRLTEVLPKIAHAGNPVDTTPMADSAAFVESVRILAADPGVDMLVVSAVPVTPTLDVLAPDLSGAHKENIFSMHSVPAQLIKTYHEIDKPMVVAVDSGRLYDPSVQFLQRSGIPVYRKIDRASRALAAVARVRIPRAEAVIDLDLC